MHFFSGFCIFFFMFSAVFLILFVLFQDEQGGGLGGLFSGSSDTPFGADVVNVLQKITTTLAVLFFISAIVYTSFNRFYHGMGISNKRLKEISQNFKEDVTFSDQPSTKNLYWWLRSESDSDLSTN